MLDQSRTRPTVPPRTRAIVLASALILPLALAACDRRETAPEAPVAAEAPPPKVVVAAPQALGRDGMIQAMRAAASRYAVNAATPDEVRALVGRPFEIVQAVGCGQPRPGAEPTPALTRVERLETGEIRLELNPADWREAALLSGAMNDSVEAAEGYWLNRPWIAGADCPAVAPDPLQPVGAPSASEFGLVALFREGGSRVGRRQERAYAHVIRGEDGAPVPWPAQGWRLVMAGRLDAFADGSPFRCRANGPDQRPTCVAAVQIDRVAFTTTDGAVLAEWRD